MATFTASEINPLKMHHIGENTVRAHFFGALSVSEVALLARVPRGVVITSIFFSGGTTGIDGPTWSLGFNEPVIDKWTGASFTANSLATAISLTSSAQWLWPRGVIAGTSAVLQTYPIHVSFSDDGVHADYTWICASGLGTLTATITSSLRLTVKYYVSGG